MRPEDEREFVEFVGGSARSFRRTAFLLTGDWHRAEDVVQVAMVKLYVAWPRLTRSGAFGAYARRAVVTCAIDDGRRPWRRERPVESADTGQANRRDETRDLDDRLVVVAALASLPPRQRAAVVLRYYDDLSVDETARVLGCTSGTVKSQTARGLDALRVRLVAAGMHEPVTIGGDPA